MQCRNNIVWLASFPKSGNTWFRIFLNNYLSTEKDPSHINEINSSRISSSRLLFDQMTGQNSSDLLQEEILRLRPKVYQRLSKEVKEDVFIKVHDRWKMIDGSIELFPREITKSVIYFIRNPLDVAVSLAFHNNSDYKQSILRVNSNDFTLSKRNDRLNNQLCQDISSWSEHVNSWIDQSKLPVLVMKYENMLSNPFHFFSEAMSFLGYPCDKQKIENAIQNSSFSILQQQEKKDSFSEKPIQSKLFFRSGQSGTFIMHLNREQISAIISKNKEMMIRFGYSIDLEFN